LTVLRVAFLVVFLLDPEIPASERDLRTYAE
jgi:hypothetical protein